jgi:hypothetical protein
MTRPRYPRYFPGHAPRKVFLFALLPVALSCLGGCDFSDSFPDVFARAAPTGTPTSTPTVMSPMFTPLPTETPLPPTSTATDTASPTPVPTNTPSLITVNGRTYDAYLSAATKKKQFYHYTCEFDAAWVVLKTYGFDVGLDEQLAIIGHDTSVEPYYEETSDGFIIYGGDIFNAYSGDYKENFLARSTGIAFRRLFEHYGLDVTAVNDQEGLEAALRRGELVWIKTTADFKPGKPSTWVLPDGSTHKTVLGNDHAAVVIGYNSKVTVIRDVLGPTNTNWDRKYEYEVSWPKFLAAWASQSYDGLAVAPPK